MSGAGVEIALILGGQRSGKSAHAEARVHATGLTPVYLGTADPGGDSELRERIRAHRDRRGPAWTTVESPHDLPAALADAAGPGRIVLADGLSVWLSNLLGAGRAVGPALDELDAVLAALPGPAVLVSDEVGLGGVSPNALARRFADWAGTMNQRVAARADHVVLVAAGLPLTLKAPETEMHA